MMKLDPRHGLIDSRMEHNRSRRHEQNVLFVVHQFRLSPESMVELAILNNYFQEIYI